jgi:hypothetical protein
MPHAVDPDAADRLWSMSEQMLGLGRFKAARALSRKTG